MDEDARRKALLRGTFDSVSGGYDSAELAFFKNAASHVPGLLGLKGDERVLDVAAGTGHTTLQLALTLAAGGGLVEAVDFSRGMLDVARAKLSAHGLANVRFHEMDMYDLAFEAASFDAAVCSFGVFFAMDMARQLRLMAHMVRPGGRVLITSFRGIPFQPMNRMFFERLRGFGVEVSPETLKRLHTEEICEALFKDAGLFEVKTSVRQAGYRLEGAEGWWEVVYNAGFRRYVERLEGRTREEFRRVHMDDVGALASGGGGLWLDVEVIYTMGEAPGPVG